MVELLFHQARRVTGLGVTAVAIALVMAFGLGWGGGTSADGFATKSAPAHAKPDGAVKKGKEKPCEGPAADKNPKCTGERPGNGDGGNGGGDADGTCATGGARGGATFAEELAGPGVEENGPVSNQIHSNEAQAQQAGVVLHELSCGVAALEGQAPAEEPPAEEPPAEEPPAEGDVSCATGGARGGATFAEELAGPGIEENGPVSGQIHSNEAQAQQAGVVLHELSCGVAALEGQAPAEEPPAEEPPVEEPPAEEPPAEGDASCATGGARGSATFAEELAGPGIEENGPVSGQIHSNEASAGEAGVVLHELSCGAAALEAQAPAQ